MNDYLDLELENTQRPDDAPTYHHGEELHQGNSSWEIGDDGAANWASMRAKDHIARIEQINQWEKDTIDRVKRVAAANRHDHQRSVDFMTGRLREYLNRLRDEGRQTKSLDLIGGKIQLRTRQPKIEVLRDGDALEWASKEHPTLVRWKASLDKTAFNKHVKLGDDGVVVDSETGEVLDFARWMEQDDSVTFTPSE